MHIKHRRSAEQLTRQQGTNLNNHQTTSHMHNAMRLHHQHGPLAPLQHTSMFSYQFSALNDQNITVQETSLLTRWHCALYLSSATYEHQLIDTLLVVSMLCVQTHLQCLEW